MRLFTLCTYLKTKESYNWWVTRRFREFRHKISQNIPKYRWQISGSFRRTPQHCAKWLLSIWVDAIRWSGYVRPEKLKRLLSHSAPEFRTWTSGWKVGGSRVQNGGAHLGAKWWRTSGYKLAVAGCKLAAAGCNSYPDMLSGCPPMVYPDALSGYTPCMDSK